MSCRTYSVIIGKYNKSDKRKFVISSAKIKKGLKTDFIKRNFIYGNKKKKEEENIYLNKIFSKEKDKSSLFGKNNEIIETNNVSNIFVKELLNERNIYYMYMYQYVLIELLKYNNLFINVLHSDCVIAYIIYSFYKIKSTKGDVSNGGSLNARVTTASMCQGAIARASTTNGKRENVYMEKLGKKKKEKKVDNNDKNNNSDNHNYKKNDNDNDDKKKNFFYPHNSTLFIGCSKEKTLALYETIIKLKSADISTYIISNEKSIDNIKKNFFLYNIIVLNIENLNDSCDLGILLEQINFVVVDDVYEIYKKKKSVMLKKIMKYCKEKQERQERGNMVQILLINKLFDGWVVNDMIQYLKNIKYKIIFEKNMNEISSSPKKFNRFSGVTDDICYNPFHYFDLRGYRKNICKHMSINAPLNDDKKFLILFYLLNINKDRKILIYYNKNDIYAFYCFINSYIPCVFISNTYNRSCKNNIVSTLRRSSDYILITNDINIRKIYQVDANLYIHYTFHESVCSYVDVLSDNIIMTEDNPVALGVQNGSSILDKNEESNIEKSSSSSTNEDIVESVLFYNSKKENKEYETLNSLLNFTNYSLPSLRILKNNFLNFLIEEIKNVVIEDHKHIEEAKKIYEKYGHSFISASLYYIQKKKVFLKNFKKKIYTNITFIVEKNILLNTKSKMINFLNELLNFKKNVGDINFFIQNYLYCKRGYILSVPEDIYNIIHKNKNISVNKEKYAAVCMYILYNNYERHFRTTHAKKGECRSKKSIRRFKKRLNIKKEKSEISKLKKWMESSFTVSARNAKKKTSVISDII
ncbi:conserved Plasmodium protein, unknown function [Plasmodium malariae]|uniref:Uncharacterized protein n=2 Tax=Plasmodium (Plasmodium) TaxID=418103 RepID=A0A1D3PCD9_PLAMA|nr:conserved Plasmodium protein, unknown function [Plasmodium malariae]SCN12645.1 conserved Plasmodium protein, unknown function [Plasmodium malariae]